MQIIHSWRQGLTQPKRMKVDILQQPTTSLWVDEESEERARSEYQPQSAEMKAGNLLGQRMERIKYPAVALQLRIPQVLTFILSSRFDLDQINDNPIGSSMVQTFTCDAIHTRPKLVNDGRTTKQFQNSTRSRYPRQNRPPWPVSELRDTW